MDLKKKQYDDTQLNCWNWLLTTSCHAAIVLLVTTVVIRNYTEKKETIQLDLLHQHNVKFENPYLIAILKLICPEEVPESRVKLCEI